MVNLAELAFCGFIGIFSLRFANRTARSARAFRSIFRIESDKVHEVIDGEPAAIEGAVIVDEPAYAADRTVDHTDSAVGAYLWRATFPKSNKKVIDFKNRNIRQARITFASGMEFGEFSVANNKRKIRVDPTWLLESHESTRLAELTAHGLNSDNAIAISLWDSPHIRLTGTKTKRTLDQLRDLTNTRDSKGLDSYHIESKPIHEDTTIAIYGNIRIEQGEPVIYGTDETPLTISEQGFDGLRNSLRFKIVKNGLVFLFSLSIIVFIFIENFHEYLIF
ncbi:hypothetical protein [Halocatena marina]|uniref:RING-type E3 ubiquitin transferase n=1 Tax=Halocatena marina TaxID=2934937 RepID=A0ABD5YUP8_9EURY|nr:hypothetical protein [Halocatena marina]